MKDVQLELESLKTVYHERVAENDEKSFEMLLQIKSVMDQIVREGRGSHYYYEVILQNMMAVYVKHFPSTEMSIEYFHYITDWFVENYEILDSLKIDSERIKDELERNKNIDVAEVNNIKRIKSRIPLLFLLADSDYFIKSRNRGIFEEWMTALKHLI